MHNLYGRPKVLFERGLWSHSELKWLDWSVSDNLTLYMCVSVCMQMHIKGRWKENQETCCKSQLCCYTTVGNSIYDHKTERRTQSGRQAGGTASVPRVTTKCLHWDMRWTAVVFCLLWVLFASLWANIILQLKVPPVFSRSDPLSSTIKMRVSMDHSKQCDKSNI